MTLPFVFLSLYVVALLAIGVVAARRAGRSPEDYFLAGSGLGSVVLFMALFGTNCTPFVLVGVPGLAYHDGLAVFGLNVPIVALGIPLSFWAIGLPARREARRLGALTPAELYARLLDHRGVGWALFAVFFLYTLPYMATAVEGGARSLFFASEEGLPMVWGGSLILGLALLYTSLGGMRATAWTNVLQGALFMGFMVAAAWVGARAVGGWSAVFERLGEVDGGRLLARPDHGLYGGGALLSWSLVISLTVISFPHMLVRLIAAKNAPSIRRVALLYPFALVALWLPAVLLGLLGRDLFPGLIGRESDQVFAMISGEVLPPTLGALGLVAVLAAVMSTLDAQLLTLGSMLSRDVMRPASDNRVEVRRGRWFGLVVAGMVFVVWRYVPGSIFSSAAVAFSGYVTLFPLLLLGLRWQRCSAGGALAGMALGNLALWVCLGLAEGPAPAAMTPVLGGLLPGAFGFLAATLGTIAGSWLWPRRAVSPSVSNTLSSRKGGPPLA
jgi:SSS family solute:Na+ symporter